MMPNEMMRFAQDDAQAAVNAVKRNAGLRRRLKTDTYADLRPFAAEIFGWAKCSGASKRVVQELILNTFGITVSCHRIYRFVIAELGYWPNARGQKKRGDK